MSANKFIIAIGVRGENDWGGGMGMLSRQNRVEARCNPWLKSAERQPAEASAEGANPTGHPPENFEKLIALPDAFSKHFRGFLVTLN